MPVKVLTLAPSEVGRATWVVEAAVQRGLTVAGIDTQGERYYWGGPIWAAANAKRLGVALLEPEDHWLSELPTKWLARSVRMMTLEDAQTVGRSFIKPPSSKDFPARVYADSADLYEETRDLAPSTRILVSDPVDFASEYRLFVLDGKVLTGSRYSSWGHADPGTLLSVEATRVCDFVEAMLEDLGDTLPSAVVIDAGLVGPPEEPRRNVAVIEANMAWFAQPYWSETDRVLDVVMRAAGPPQLVRSATAASSDRPDGGRVGRA